MKLLDKLCHKTMSYIPERLLGSENEYKRSLGKVYGNRDVQESIDHMRYENCKKYVLIVLVFATLTGISLVKDIVLGEEWIYLSDEGQQYVLRPEQGEKAYVLKLTGGKNGEIDKEIQIKLKSDEIIQQEKEKKESGEGEAVEREKSIKEDIAVEINTLIENIQKDESKERVVLPKEIEGVGKIKWQEKGENSWFIFMLIGMSLCLFIYVERFGVVKKIEMQCQASIERELPEFLNKVVLLMNAGLVLSVAFERIVAGYESAERKESYFYNQLKEIKRKMEETNSPMIYELKGFADRSGNREFIRATNLMYENLNKGTKLIESLENESNFLWFQRKKRGEEKGKIAETKLTLPLAMELFALIIITIMPAMLDMQ